MNNEHERKRQKRLLTKEDWNKKVGVSGEALEREAWGGGAEEDMKRREGSDNGTDGEVLVQADLAERAPLICKCSAAA